MHIHKFKSKFNQGSCLFSQEKKHMSLIKEIEEDTKKIKEQPMISNWKDLCY